MTQAGDQASDSPYLLSPQFLRKLEQATVASKHIMVGRTKGERRSARRGSSVEFADFRAYNPGDDLRYLDWNAYARLQRLFLKLFIEEEDLHVYIVVDGSRSMDFGRPTKFTWAVQAAAALSYIALCGGDRVQAFAHSEGEADRSRLCRGRGSAPELFAWLSERRSGGEMSLLKAVRSLQSTAPAPGLTFVISDLLTPEWEAALGQLAAAKGEACLLQVFSKEEFEPSARGDLRLIDSETGGDREVTMGATVLRRYGEERDGFLSAVRAVCSRYGFSYLFSRSEEAVEDVILKSLRRLRVIA
ncbi:MAG TPA: DUF58 domain-containing protein [Armatimonadota bacterium]|nr:DUF58 domain-containing protein [Armatimonadota bacterium]